MQMVGRLCRNEWDIHFQVRQSHSVFGYYIRKGEWV